MNDLLAHLAESPSIYPQKLDFVRGAIVLINMTESEYRATSFLDDRILTPDKVVTWVSTSQIIELTPKCENNRPLHFIFHSGHVGSTLLSRMLDATGIILGLREPLPLRTLAEIGDVVGTFESLLSPKMYVDHLETFLHLWSRGFPDTDAVVVKATSTTGRLAPDLLAARHSSRGIYLNLEAEPFLATLLAVGRGKALDMRRYAPERIRRLRTFIGEVPKPLHAMKRGELVAMSWLVERLTQARTAALCGGRLLFVDFETLLSDVEVTLASVLFHFGIRVPDKLITAIANGPVMTRYSKAPDEVAYSSVVRAQRLSEARQTHSDDIKSGLAFLEQLGSSHPAIAEVLR
jgi:hypothetical protein